MFCFQQVDVFIFFKEMEYIKIDLPPGCVDRPDISVILKSQRNSQSAEKAKNEYIDLLKTELRFAQDTMYMCWGKKRNTFFQCHRGYLQGGK
jgi:hypothetical protein